VGRPVTYDPRLASAEDVAALQMQINQKANASTVGGIATALNSKASQSSVDALASAKADAVTVTALSSSVATKADKTSVDAVAASLSSKADSGAVAALATAVGSKASQSSVDAISATLPNKADVSAIPVAANTMPPAVTDESKQGSQARYAREDHTHASSVQARRVALTLANGKAPWAFPVPFPSGTVPVVECTAETPDGAAYKYDARSAARPTSRTRSMRCPIPHRPR